MEKHTFLLSQARRRRLAGWLLSAAVVLSTGCAVALSPVSVDRPVQMGQAAPAKPAEKPAAKDDKPVIKTSAAEIDASIASATTVDPLDLLREPTRYLNKKVTFTGTFNRFADIALDYKKAFRDSRDYVTFFILRPDVKEYTIPLSELKLFFSRKKSDEVMDLESGDSIQVVGTQFSSALDEPWIDVEHIKILKKLPRPDKAKHVPEF